MLEQGINWTCVLIIITLNVPLTNSNAESGDVVNELQILTQQKDNRAFVINNIYDFYNITQNLSGTYILTSNIDASETINWNNGQGFSPISNTSSPFNGTLDGRGYVITGIHINRSNQDYIGVFGAVSASCAISNISLRSVSISGKQNVGSLVGFNSGGSIINCSVTGNVSGQSDNIGGLVGWNNKGNISNSYSMVVLAGSNTSIAGGLIGLNENGLVENCYASGTVKMGLGGLVGFNTYGTIINCHNTGSVFGINCIGGLVGFNDGLIQNCTNSGRIQGFSIVGGISGENRIGTISNSSNTGPVIGGDSGGLVGFNSRGEVKTSYNTGSISGQPPIHPYFDGRGGIVGENYAKVMDCFSTGSVSGGWQRGGLVGFHFFVNGGIILNCYWDIQSSGLNTSSGGGYGKNTYEMMKSGTYSGWDFSGTWGIFQDQTYPYLRWRYPSAVLVSGTARKDSEGNTTGPKTNIGIIDHVGLSVAHNDTLTDSNGRFKQIADKGPIGIYYMDGALVGSSYYDETGINYSTLDVYNDTILISGDAKKVVSSLSLANLKSRHYTEGLCYSYSINEISGYDGITFKTTENTTFQIERNITIPGSGILSFGGNVTQDRDINLTARLIEFGSQINAKHNLTLLSDGTISFQDTVRILDLTMKGIDRVEASASLDARYIVISSESDVQVCSDFTTTGNLSIDSKGDILFNGSLSARTLSVSDSTDLVFAGKSNVTIMNIVSLNDIRFLSDVTVKDQAYIKCQGDIIFEKSADIKKVIILEAHDAIFNDVLKTQSFKQQFGTGTTDFWNGLLEMQAGSADIRTRHLVGFMIVVSLSLETDSALIYGQINNQSGQVGADSIKLSRDIRIGTHFFDGIDLYKFTPLAIGPATEDRQFSVKFQPMDSTNESIIWSIEGKPEWLSLDNETGVISGIPRNEDVGTNFLEVTAHDGLKSRTQYYKLEVLNTNDPPTIITPDIIYATESVYYSNYYEAVDMDPTDENFSWDLQTDAGWLKMTGNHLWGTPSNRDAGTYTINITVSDEHGGIDSHAFVLTVNFTNDAPQITTDPYTKATQGLEYKCLIEAIDPDVGERFTWSLDTTANWLAINSSSGVLSGVPLNDDVGLTWGTISVRDNGGNIDSIDFMISVVNVNDAPVWQTVCNDQNLTEMEPLLCNVWAMDVDIGDIVTYDMSMQPVSDITIDQTTGVIFWERSVVGNYSMNVSATDGEVIIYHTFIIKVNKIPPNNPPQFKSIPAVQAETGHLFRMVIEGIDADPWDEINLSFRLVSGPEGMIISTNGTILWLPMRGQAGSHTITVTLSDGKNSTEKSFQVSVLKSSEKSDVAATGYSIGWLVAIAIIGIIIGGGMAYAATRNAKRKTISAKAHDYGDDKNNNK